MTKCSFMDKNVSTTLVRWVEFVTIIQSQTHKSYVLGVSTLFSLFITKFWSGELVKLICPAILVKGLGLVDGTYIALAFLWNAEVLD